MDPNEALRRLREIAKNVMEIDDRESPEGLDDTLAAGLQDLAVEMAGHFEALDRWIQNGGFLPNTWAEVDATVAWVASKDPIGRELENLTDAVRSGVRFHGDHGPLARENARENGLHLYRVVKA